MLTQRIMRYIVNSTLSKFINNGSRYIEFTMQRSDPRQECIHVRERLDFTGGGSLTTKLQNFTESGVYYNKYTKQSYVLTDEEMGYYRDIISGFSAQWKHMLAYNNQKIIKGIRNKTILLMSIITICAILVVWASSLLNGNYDSMVMTFVSGVTITLACVYCFSAFRMTKQLDGYFTELTKELR